MITEKIKDIYKSFRGHVSKYPFETNLVFFFFGVIITAATFQNALRIVLTSQIQVWHVLTGAVLLSSWLMVRTPRRIIKALLSWRFLGLWSLLVIVVFSVIYLVSRPDLRALKIIDAEMDFPTDLKQKDEFTARSLTLMCLHDALALASVFPFLFKESATNEIDSMLSAISAEADSIFEAIAARPFLRIRLFVNNGLETATTIYKATGELRFGDPKVFLQGDLLRIEGRTIITDEYLKGGKQYLVDFHIATEKMRLSAGSGADTVELSWRVPADLCNTPTFRQALLFELRRLDFMDYAENDYKYYLKEIYRDFIEKKSIVPSPRPLGLLDFKLMGVQADIVLEHTHGQAEFRKTFAIGLIEGVEPSEVVRAWK